MLNLIVIGEAASRLLRAYPGFDEQHPGIPWRSIKGMRNRIAHGYFDVDMTVVWQTVIDSLPNLIADLERIRAGLSAPPRA